MPQKDIVFYNSAEETDDGLDINIEKLWKAIWSRKILLIKVFCAVLILFILLTFILPKKYKVTADLYINKANSSNMIEINPYILDEASGSMLSVSADKTINNEMELIKSELVLDKVIRDNNLIYKKKWGIIPNKKEGEFLTSDAFYENGKKLKIENSQNTNVIHIEYVNKNPKIAYGVVSSLIANYIDLHKDLNAEKSKSDKKLLEQEYAIVKENLNQSLNQVKGMPTQSMTGVGNLSAMSAFSSSASRAIETIKSQILANERTQIAVSEESQKLAQLSAKLEWAKLVEQMSDSSKVLILKEPKLLRPFEQSSPKLLINIILGCIFGYLSAIVALFFAEITDKKLSYSMLTNNIIFDGENKQELIENISYGFNPQKILCLSFEQLSESLTQKLQNLPNTNIEFFNGVKEATDEIIRADKIILISKINVTDTYTYKIIRDIIKSQQKNIIYDVLI